MGSLFSIFYLGLRDYSASQPLGHLDTVAIVDSEIQQTLSAYLRKAVLVVTVLDHVVASVINGWHDERLIGALVMRLLDSS